MSYTQLLSTILKSSFKAIIALLFIGSLAMNIITMTWTTEGIAAKGALAAVASIASVAADLGSKLAASEKVVIGLRGELDASEKVATGLRGNLAVSEKVVNGLRGNLAANKKVVTGLRGELAANEVTITDLGTKLAAKEVMIADLIGKLAASVKDAIDLKNRLNANKKAVSRITKNITRRTILGVGRNITAAYAEAIPGPGVAVIVGVTAWELYDACQTMKDMDEINKSMGIDDTVEKDKVCGKKLPSIKEIVKAIKSSPGKVLASVRKFGVDIPEDALEDIPEDALEDIPEDISEDTPEDAQEDEREDTGKGGNFFRNSWESARKYFSDD